MRVVKIRKGRLELRKITYKGGGTSMTGAREDGGRHGMQSGG